MLGHVLVYVARERGVQDRVSEQLNHVVWEKGKLLGWIIETGEEYADVTFWETLDLTDEQVGYILYMDTLTPSLSVCVNVGDWDLDMNVCSDVLRVSLDGSVPQP